jgi:hypothetical protein
MAENYDDDDLDYDGSDLVKDLRKQIKALQKEKTDISQELSSLQSVARERSVAEVLAARGLSSKVANVIPSNVNTTEALNEWLENNAEIFGIAPAAETTPTPGADAATVQSTQRLQTLNKTAQVPTQALDLEARFAAANTAEEIAAIWKDVNASLL